MDYADVEIELDRWIAKYERTMVAVEAARAEHFALADEPLASPAAIARARVVWQQLEHRRLAIRRQIDLLEDQDRSAA